MPTATRVLGALTAGYSVALAAQPKVLAKPLKLTRLDGSVDPTVAMLCRGIAVRDTVSGLAMVFAPEGTPLRTATVIRAVSDIGDAVVFGIGLTDPGTQKDDRVRLAVGAALPAQPAHRLSRRAGNAQLANDCSARSA